QIGILEGPVTFLARLGSARAAAPGSLRFLRVLFHLGSFFVCESPGRLTGRGGLPCGPLRVLHGGSPPRRVLMGTTLIVRSHRPGDFFKTDRLLPGEASDAAPLAVPLG